MPDVALAKGWLSPVTTKKLETKFKKTQKNGPQKHTRKPRGLFLMTNTEPQYHHLS